MFGTFTFCLSEPIVTLLHRGEMHVVLRRAHSAVFCVADHHIMLALKSSG